MPAVFSLPVSLVIVAFVAGWSAWVGDYATRRIAIAVLAGWFATLGLAVILPWRLAWWPLFGVDLAVLTYFFWISLRTRLLWTAAAAALQAVVVASHLATVIDLRVTLNTFRLGAAVWSYGILACVATGAVLSVRRRRGQGSHAQLHADVVDVEPLSPAAGANQETEAVFPRAARPTVDSDSSSREGGAILYELQSGPPAAWRLAPPVIVEPAGGG